MWVSPSSRQSDRGSYKKDDVCHPNVKRVPDGKGRLTIDLPKLKLPKLRTVVVLH